MEDTAKQTPPEVSEFFSKIGKMSGDKIKKDIEEGKKPADYFSRISKMRKTHGRQKVTPNTPVDK